MQDSSIQVTGYLTREARPSCGDITPLYLRAARGTTCNNETVKVICQVIEQSMEHTNRQQNDYIQTTVN